LGLLAVVGTAFEALDLMGGEYRIDVDVMSGRVRTQRFVLGVCARERYTETEFAELVREFSLSDSARVPEWHCVNIQQRGLLAFGGLSWGTGYYEGPLLHCLELARLIRLRKLSGEEGRRAVAEFLGLLEKGDIDTMADSMRRRLEDLEAKISAHR
jgi:hypothetical protein